MRLNITAGVIDRARLLAFERMLWRVSKGNVFMKFADLDCELEDPGTGNLLNKAIFIIFYQGVALRSRVKKICDGFHACVYPCPDTAVDRCSVLLSESAVKQFLGNRC